MTSRAGRVLDGDAVAVVDRHAVLREGEGSFSAAFPAGESEATHVLVVDSCLGNREVLSSRDVEGIGVVAQLGARTDVDDDAANER